MKGKVLMPNDYWLEIKRDFLDVCGADDRTTLLLRGMFFAGIFAMLCFHAETAELCEGSDDFAVVRQRWMDEVNKVAEEGIISTIDFTQGWVQ